MSEKALLALLPQHALGVLATLRSCGRPQLSNINYAYSASEQCVRISTTADRAKLKNLRRDPRASLHVTAADGWAWTVVEGTAEVTAPAAGPDDDVTEELVAVYRALRGEHPDWDEYRAAMVADRRLVVRLPVGRVYGQPRR